MFTQEQNYKIHSLVKQVAEHEEITNDSAAHTSYFHNGQKQEQKKKSDKNSMFISDVNSMTLHFTNLRLMLSLRAE